MPWSTLLCNSVGLLKKRSHDQSARSEGSKDKSDPPLKRMCMDYPSFSRPESHTVPVVRRRFVGDGLDFRSPAMSGNHSANIRDAVDTIDLTLDDEDYIPAGTSSAQRRPRNEGESTRPDRSYQRAPPFTFAGASPEVIDLADSDDENEDRGGDGGERGGEDGRGRPRESTPHLPTVPEPLSPELEFIGERARIPPNVPLQRHASRTLPPPIGFGSLADIIRDARQSMFSNFQFRHEGLGDVGLGRRGEALHYRPPATSHSIGDLTIYEDVDLDYGLAGFALHPAEEPQPPLNQNSRDYKAPGSAREGFTRTYDEEDVLVCGFCGHELAAGDDEIRAQVWVIKQCGHAYCGTCAHSRVFGKSNASRDKKRGTPRKSPAFKTCTAPGCDKAVDSKTKMFQIYL